MSNAAYEELLARAKKHKMSVEEAEAQRLSFAYGNLNIEDPSITRDSIHLAAQKLAKETRNGAKVSNRSTVG